MDRRQTIGRDEDPGVEKARIGIYGGTFDPIHIGHLISAESAYHLLDLEKVVFIPAYAPPHKENRSKTADHRLAMLKLAIEDNSRFVIDEREIHSKEVNYTLNTILSLMEDRPDAQFFYMMGEDSLLQIESWYKWEELLSLIDIAVVKRPNSQDIAFEDYKLEKRAFTDQLDFLRKRGYHIHVIDEFPVDISSTKLRNYLQEGIDVRYLIPDKVLNYIEKEGLYD